MRDTINPWEQTVRVKLPRVGKIRTALLRDPELEGDVHYTYDDGHVVEGSLDDLYNLIAMHYPSDCAVLMRAAGFTVLEKDGEQRVTFRAGHSCRGCGEDVMMTLVMGEDWFTSGCGGGGRCALSTWVEALGARWVEGEGSLGSSVVLRVPDDQSWYDVRVDMDAMTTELEIPATVIANGTVVAYVDDCLTLTRDGIRALIAAFGPIA